MTEEEMRLQVLDLAVRSTPTQYNEHVPRAEKYLEFVMKKSEQPQKVQSPAQAEKPYRKSDNPRVLP